MTRKRWRETIKSACETAGTYQPFFDSVIDTLAGILETRDKAERQFKKGGSEMVLQHTNARGATNNVKNPALVLLLDCNAQALAYWKELGLTSRSYKAMTGSLSVKVESRGFEEVLADLGI